MLQYTLPQKNHIFYYNLLQTAIFVLLHRNLRNLYCNITRLCTYDVTHTSSKPHGKTGISVVLSDTGI